MGIPPSTAPQKDQIILPGWGWISTPHPLLPKHSQITSVVPPTHGLAWPNPLRTYAHSLQLPTPPLPQPISPSLALKGLPVTPWPPVAGASMVTYTFTKSLLGEDSDGRNLCLSIAPSSQAPTSSVGDSI